MPSTGRITRALIADVSGHGAAVSSTAAASALMRRYINYVKPSPGRVSTKSLPVWHRRATTAVVATYWGPSRRDEITNAATPRLCCIVPLLGRWGVPSPARQEGDGLSDIPLGIDDVTTYARMRTRLERGDLLLFYTDALIEAHEADGKMLGVSGLIDALERLDASQPEKLMLASAGRGRVRRRRGNPGRRHDADAVPSQRPQGQGVVPGRSTSHGPRGRRVAEVPQARWRALPVAGVQAG